MRLSSPSLKPLLAGLLEEQARLHTPVAEFATRPNVESNEPLQARYYKKLIPLSAPGPGEQYAFEVDLERCTGCKACVTACHSQNGLDEDESWRDVGTLLVSGRAQPYLQTVTAACHHCEDPACALGCPVLAYEKVAETGIVRHLDDQCIGCRYCMMKCPYDVPKYSAARGIVRKCDMCHDRLAEGEAPACVQACPGEAITIRIVSLGTRPSGSERLLPGAFPSNYTRPTTRYRSRDPLPVDADADDYGTVRLDHSHPSLAWMLVMTQMAAGGFLIGAISNNSPEVEGTFAGVCAAFALGGVLVGALHLGRPQKAWRAFLGWRHSWLSREVLAFGAFISLACLAAAVGLLTKSENWLFGLMLASAGTGVMAVACSVMVYVDTRRPFWSWKLAGSKFGGTMLLLGSGLFAGVDRAMAFAAASTAVTALFAGGLWQWRALADPASPVHLPASVLHGLLRRQSRTRNGLLAGAAFLFLGGAMMPSFLLSLVGLGSAFAAILIERHQFFTACSSPRLASR